MPEISGRLREALDSGATVVASSPLLAREIERNYSLSQSRRGISAWLRPTVWFWEQWLRYIGEQVLWSGYSSPSGRRQFLTPVQEQVLWERIVSGSRAPSPPINIYATAQLAREAWNLLQQWRLPDPGTVGFPTAEQQAFSRWMRHYHRECVDHAWLDGARVIDSLIPAIASGAVAVPDYVALVGFEQFNPQQRGLLRAMAGMGTRLASVKPTTASGNAVRVRLPEPTAELQTAVRWLRNLVTADGSQRAGLVVPSLDANYLQIERLLDEALLPGHSLPGTDLEIQRPYMIAAGRALRKQPVVVAADHLLAMSMGTISMRVLSRIIRSPFLSGGINQAARLARFDLWVREQGSVDVDLQHMPEMLESFRHATGLATEDFTFEQRVTTMLEQHDDGRLLQPSQWGRYFQGLLDLFGWPGETRLNAIQEQARRVFEVVMRDFSSLDPISGELPAAEALRLLRQLLRQRMFRFEAPNVPILVLGPEDAAQLQFDQLWICRAGSSEWPGLDLQPNPLLPLEWQQEAGLPSGSAKARSDYRSKLAAQLCTAGSAVIVSQSQSSDALTDNVFRGLPLVDADTIEQADLTDYRLALVGSAGMEIVADQQGPALDPVEMLDLDQQVLAAQAACPFQAFARLRLDARAPKELRPGLLPEARVRLLKMALEHVWHRIESSEVLQAALAGEHLEVQVWEIADTVLAVFERKLPVHLSRRYRALEHARLVRLILQWLRVETRRAPFTVQRTDAHTSIQLNGITLRAQVDRIDQVDERGLAIIAYDTQPFALEHWLGDRPDSPVLILYALASTETPAALLTGCVAAERMSLDGIQHEAGVISYLPVYEESAVASASGLGWEELLDHWRTTLSALSKEFADGVARVAPKYGARTCADCDLASFCRVADRVPS